MANGLRCSGLLFCFTALARGRASLTPILQVRLGLAREQAEVMCHCEENMKPYTPRQGQFLAFIFYYTKLNGRPPAESDMQRYFRITAPAVHQMVVTLEDRGFIERTPRQSRSIRLRLVREELPDLE